MSSTAASPRTNPYRRVLSLPGATAFSAAGLVARFPISMVTLGLVILVSDRTGSYSTAGGVSAAYIAANAVGAVPVARLVDRWGQARTLGTLTTWSCLMLAMVLVAVEGGWDLPWPHVFAVLSGLTFPNVGAAVRARWSHAVGVHGLDRPALDTAFALEAVNDEVVFILGPTLVTLLAASVHPLAGLATALVAALLGTWALALQHGTSPPPAPPRGTAPVAPLPWLTLAPLLLGAVTVGVVLGGCEVATVALADERGSPAAAGVLLAVWALGSLISGLVSGAMTFRRGPGERYRLGSLALAVLTLPLPFVHTLPALGAFLFLCGFAISPTMIAAVSWVETLVPAGRLNEGIAVFTTGLVAGIAPGAALVGIVVDRSGASASYWVPVGTAFLGVAVAFLTGVVARRSPRPGVPLT